MSLIHIRFKNSCANKSYKYEELVYNYGKRLADRLIASEYYMGYFKMPTDETLIEIGFNPKYLQRIKRNLINGRPVEHINKKTGTIKKGYKKHSMAQVLKRYKNLDENKRNVECYYFVTHRLSYLVSKSIIAKFRDLKIDTKTDPITLNDIQEPAYIKSDWESGCKVVMDITTIHKCAQKNYIPWYVHTTPDGQEMLVYKCEYTGNYVSPYTRNIFCGCDIVRLPSYVTKIK